MAKLNIVLHEPEIPANTGNIGRTCVATGTRLHLIEPLGFSLSEKALKRAGMDYWKDLDVTTYLDFEDFLEKNPGAKIYYATTKAPQTYTDVHYEEDCYIMFGKESAGIPEDLWEAAQLDGCGYLGFFFKIVLPLSKAVIAVIALWAAVGQWNSYFNALIYIRSESLQPLQIVLRSILVGNQPMSAMSTGAAAVEAKQMADLIKYAIIVVSSAPIMCMYPLVQKYFNQGVMLGSLKG